MHRLYSSRRYKPKGVHRGDVTNTERKRERERVSAKEQKRKVQNLTETKQTNKAHKKERTKR